MNVMFVTGFSILSTIVCAVSLIAACCIVIDHYDEGWKGALHSILLVVSLLASIFLNVWLVDNTCEVRCNNCQTEWVATSSDNIYCHVCGTKLERRE